MAEPTLAEMVEFNPEAKQILSSDVGHTASVHLLRGLGVETTEQAIRRYRKNAAQDTPSTPKTSPHLKGWEPYAEEAGRVGKALLRLPNPNATEHDLLVGAGFDPDAWRIKGSVNTRRWMRYDQEWLYYYKFDVEQGESRASVDLHIEELVKRIRKRSDGRKFAYGGGGTYVLVIADWQIGKAEGGKGSADTVARWKDCLEQARLNIIALRRMGVDISRLAILGLGDLIEGCADHYDMQTFSVDLDRRSQNRVVREMLTDTLLTLVPMFDHTTVAVIGGNHGENRKKGKAFTTFADNDDVAGPEAVMEAFNLAGWTNITWYIPDEDLSMCVELSGVKVGIVHGHQFRGGVNALKKAEDWWRANVFGLEPVNDAQILLSGHFHHHAEFNIAAGRSWIQSPTIDPGSKWYSDTSGVTSTPGVLTFVLNSAHPLGYDYKRVLAPVS